MLLYVALAGLVLGWAGDLSLDISIPCWPQDITRRLNYITVYEPFNTSLDPAYVIEPQVRFSSQQWKDDSPVFPAFRFSVYRRFIVYCHQPTCHPMATAWPEQLPQGTAACYQLNL